jgi:hypothetical protein
MTTTTDSPDYRILSTTTGSVPQSIDVAVETAKPSEEVAQEPAAADEPSTNVEGAVGDAITSVQAEPDYVHQSAEHLENRVIAKLVEWGHDVDAATRAVRARLY